MSKIINAKEKQANKGEWSELYVLFKIFVDRYVAAAGPNLEPLPNVRYIFKKIIREEVQGNVLVYDLTNNDGVIVLDNKGNILSTVSTSQLHNKTIKIFRSIKEARSASFIMNDLKPLMDEYLIKKVKANSSQKVDLLAVIPDNIGTTESKLGFSIKSHIGGAPTLVNSSSHTNFVYEVLDFKGDINLINSIEGKSKIRDRIIALKNAGATLKLERITSEIYKNNLRMADTLFPQVIAHMLLNFFSSNGNDFTTLAKLVGEDPSIDISEGEAIHKLKAYLRSSALGMVPGKTWDGELKAYGGYIIVLNDGRLVCYHLFNDDEFREYLFRHTKFDTPSTTKYDFGYVYNDQGKLKLNLNLQIRFLNTK